MHFESKLPIYWLFLSFYCPSCLYFAHVPYRLACTGPSTWPKQAHPNPNPKTHPKFFYSLYAFLAISSISFFHPPAQLFSSRAHPGLTSSLKAPILRPIPIPLFLFFFLQSIPNSFNLAQFFIHNPFSFYTFIHGHRTLKAPHPV